MKYGKIQDRYALLRHVSGPVMHLDLSGVSRYRSVIEITGTCLLDDEKQQDLYEMYHRIFLSLDHPLQVIIRIRPLNIEAYLHYMEDQEESEGQETWEALAHSHATLLRTLTRQRPPLARRFYLIVPAEEEIFAWERFGQRKREQKEMDLLRAAQQLRLRTETLESHLHGLGLICRLLANEQLTRFYSSFFLSHASLDDEQCYVQVERDSICVGDQHYLRVQRIADLPRVVHFGWLKPLVEVDETIDIIHHLKPRRAESILPYLRRQQAHAQATMPHTSEAGRLADPDAAIANDDLEPLVAQIAAGEQSMLESSLHLLIRAASKEELDQRTRRVMSRVSATFTRRPRTCTFEQAGAFRACLPGMMIGRDVQLLPSNVVASMIPFHDHFVFRPGETALFESITQHDEPVILDWWRDSANANRIICGPSGWGKSYKSKLDIMHLYAMHKRFAQRHRPPPRRWFSNPDRRSRKGSGSCTRVQPHWATRWAKHSLFARQFSSTQPV